MTDSVDIEEAKIDRSAHSRNSFTNASTANTSINTGTGSATVVTRLAKMSREEVESLREQLEELEEPDRPDEDRKAHLFCGCCCDLRQACFTVDAVYITLLVMAFLAGYRYVEWLERVGRNSVDPIFVIINSSLSLTFCILGIVGAWKYWKWLILLTFVWLLVDAALSIVVGMWPGAILKLFFSYPQIAFFLALMGKKITPENYQRSERHCCV